MHPAPAPCTGQHAQLHAPFCPLAVDLEVDLCCKALSCVVHFAFCIFAFGILPCAFFCVFVQCCVCFVFDVHLALHYRAPHCTAPPCLPFTPLLCTTPHAQLHAPFFTLSVYLCCKTLSVLCILHCVFCIVYFCIQHFALCICAVLYLFYI